MLPNSSARNLVIPLLLVPFLLCVSGCVGPPTSHSRNREPTAGRTLVFSRAQMKYGLDRNYLRRWTDRPLFQDTSLREARSAHVTPFGSFSRVMGIVKDCGIDGLAFLPETTRRMGIFEHANREPPGGFALLPEFLSYRDLDKKLAMLDAAEKCAATIRIRDRIPITAYHSDSIPLDDWKDMLSKLRARYGNKFLFLPDIQRPAGIGWMRWCERWNSDSPPSHQDKERIRAYLRSWAAVFDGLYFAGCHALKTSRKFDDRFYRKFLIPLFNEVMDEPRFRSKYLGLSACIGHENCTRLGYTLSCEGTKTLRRSFETASRARPDLIVLPEWDEQNENTSFRPTVYNSFSTQRILRYYMSRIKNEPLRSRLDDDASVPNLVISHRKILTLGEVLEIEILFVPDAEMANACSARLRLKNLEGRIVWQSKSLRFSGRKLEDNTIRIPSETFSMYPVLRPSLVVRSGSGEQTFEDGLHHIRIRPTWNWDYKWVKTPLRDLCQPSAVGFRWSGAQPGADGLYRCEGNVTSKEDIASVEILDEDAVVFAVTPGGDSHRETESIETFCMELRSFRRKRFRGHLRVEGAEGLWPEKQASIWGNAKLMENKFSASTNVDWYPRQLFLGIRTKDVPKAALILDSDIASMSVSASDLIERDIISRTLDDGLTVTFSRYVNQADHPMHLNRKQVQFSARISPDHPNSVFHMRVITRSGKIYRSAPLMLRDAGSSGTVTLPVYSEAKGEPVQVAITKRRIPEILYRMSPDRGSVLDTETGRCFRGHLGGMTDSVTFRGGDGGLDGSPFVRRSNFPESAKSTAPVWTRDEGTDFLEFDGNGNFIALPQGALPRRGAFRLSFEIKPDRVDLPQILFAHHGYYIGSLVVRIESGKLFGSFVNDKLKVIGFDSGLQLAPGRWHTIEVMYDLKHMRFSIGGKECAPMNCRGVGLYDTTSVFGGFGGTAGKLQPFIGKAGWFKGKLRKLKIAHRS